MFDITFFSTTKFGKKTGTVFTTLNYLRDFEWAQEATVFVLGKPFQQTLMFVSKAGSLP